MSRCVVYWFRKALRLHDNPALLEATKLNQTLLPIFILDPAFTQPRQQAATCHASGPAAAAAGSGVGRVR
jgi:deoxyribodipyrimidine photolyase